MKDQTSDAQEAGHTNSMQNSILFEMTVVPVTICYSQTEDV